MIERHWKLSRDPFAGPDPAFVPTPGHAEALARLAFAIESGDRSVELRGASGLGKSIVLDRALRAARSPSRRIARARRPTDGPSLLADLAEALGARPGPSPSRSSAWRALAEAVRLCRLQRLGVVLAVEDDQDLIQPADRLDLDRLGHIDPHPEARVTVVRVGREPADESADPWSPAIRLVPLTRSDAQGYLAAKLGAAGRRDPTFTPRAATKLHALAGGVPRGLDRLASLALLAGAARGLEVIGPELIEGVARECLGPGSLAIGA